MAGLCRAVIAVVFLGIVESASALECFTCSNATAVSECTTTQTCGSGEICFAEHHHFSNAVSVSFGCRAETECAAANTSTPTPVTLIGRSANTESCSECCREQHCNRHLCQQTYKECSDSSEVNCVAIENLVNICSDTKRAITICRRFCGLCYYTNGNWSDWSSWSNCDVTCENGTQTRTRACTNPTPSLDGLPCSGSNSESKNCSLESCPVHGGWTKWNAWGGCSTTCGIGMQHRDRICSNTHSERIGDQCYGASRDDKLCVEAVCPVTNGGWSLWTTWTTCTETCNGGIRTRNRDCTNPSPSAGGKSCTGSPYEVAACNSQTCPRFVSYFTFSNPLKNIMCTMILSQHGSCNLAFQTILQQGGELDGVNGLFRCKYPGLYFFFVTLIGQRFDCEIEKNGNAIAYVKQAFPAYKYYDQTASREGGTVTLTASVNTHLLQGDTIRVSCTYIDNSFFESQSSFSGFLVDPDL